MPNNRTQPEKENLETEKDILSKVKIPTFQLRIKNLYPRKHQSNQVTWKIKTLTVQNKKLIRKQKMTFKEIPPKKIKEIKNGPIIQARKQTLT